MSWLSSAIGVLGGAAAAKITAEKTAKTSRKEADRNRAFQKMMSDTAHQREMEDLRAAGLNPILSARLGGASTPPGGMGPVPDIGRNLTSAIGAATNLRAANANIRETTARADKSEIDAKLHRDMYDMYEGSSALQKATQAGKLSQVAGVPSTAGALAGAGSSAAKGVLGTVDQWLEGKQKRHYRKLNKSAESLRRITINGKQIELR